MMRPNEIRSKNRALTELMMLGLIDSPTQMVFIFDRIYLRNSTHQPERQFEILRESCGELAEKLARELHLHYLSLGVNEKIRMRSNALNAFEQCFQENNLDFDDYPEPGISLDAIVGDVRAIRNNRSHIIREREEVLRHPANAGGDLSRLLAMGVNISFTGSSSSSSTRAPVAPVFVSRAIHDYKASPIIQGPLTIHPPIAIIEGKEVNLQSFSDHKKYGIIWMLYKTNEGEVRINGYDCTAREILDFYEKPVRRITAVCAIPPSVTIENVKVDLGDFADKNYLTSLHGRLTVAYGTSDQSMLINGKSFEANKIWADTFPGTASEVRELNATVKIEGREVSLEAFAKENKAWPMNHAHFTDDGKVMLNDKFFLLEQIASFERNVNGAKQKM